MSRARQSRRPSPPFWPLWRHHPIIMYGKSRRGPDGFQYDSREEAEVARHLDALTLEHIIRGYLPHPIIARLQIDFLIQLGSASGANRHIVLVEYDGLGEERGRSLEPRLHRF